MDRSDIPSVSHQTFGERPKSHLRRALGRGNLRRHGRRWKTRDTRLSPIHVLENDQFVLSLEYALAKESLTLTAPIRVKDSRYGEPTPFEDFTWKNRDGRLFILTTVYDRQAVEHAVAYFANH